MFAFEGLHSGQFIVTNHLFALLSQLWGALIQVIDVADFLIGLLIVPRGQPVAAEMGFDVPLFLKDVRRDAARWFQQSFV
jgi:hypothetical protein